MEQATQAPRPTTAPEGTEGTAPEGKYKMGQCTQAAKDAAKDHGGEVASVRVQASKGNTAEVLFFGGQYSDHNIAILDGKVVVDPIHYPNDEMLSLQEYATRLVNDVFKEKRPVDVIFQIGNNGPFKHDWPGEMYLFDKGKFIGQDESCIIS